MDVFQVFRDRRSIRKYKETPVELEKIEQILDAAGYSGPCRPRFRRDGDRRSDLMPIGIPVASRPQFR